MVDKGFKPFKLISWSRECEFFPLLGDFVLFCFLNEFLTIMKDYVENIETSFLLCAIFLESLYFDMFFGV